MVKPFGNMRSKYISELETFQQQITELQEKLKISGSIGRELLKRLDQTKLEYELLRDDFTQCSEEKELCQRMIGEMAAKIALLQQDNFRHLNSSESQHLDPNIVFAGQLYSKQALSSYCSLMKQIEAYKQQAEHLNAKIDEDYIEMNALRRENQFFKDKVNQLMSLKKTVKASTGTQTYLQTLSNGNQSLQYTSTSLPLITSAKRDGDLQIGTDPELEDSASSSMTSTNSPAIIESLKQHNLTLVCTIQELERTVLMQKVQFNSNHVSYIIESLYIFLSGGNRTVT